MSGFSQSSVSFQNSRGTKKKWVPKEDAALVACMVDLHNVGTFNADTRFKAGYLNELEKMLEIFLPNAMLKAKPNLESRIRILKRDWSIVYDMFSGKNNSGFGWDEHRQVVVAEDAVWNSYINTHKEAGQFKHSSFPYYDQLTAIYTKDRATGKDAQTDADIIEEIDVKNTHKEAGQFKHSSFPYYDQLTAIYTKDRATGKDAQTDADIIEEIDVKNVTTTNTHEERNDFYGCEADVSLDDIDLSATQLQPARNQGDSTFLKKKKIFLMQEYCLRSANSTNVRNDHSRKSSNDTRSKARQMHSKLNETIQEFVSKALDAYTKERENQDFKYWESWSKKPNLATKAHWMSITSINDSISVGDGLQAQILEGKAQ
ncbi:hypothetical protein GOBAR_DD16349 [Gossypium barbadense]|nr:hypothetical protein GOBAR_DD16349 [Gossypium barbadense]